MTNTENHRSDVSRREQLLALVPEVGVIGNVSLRRSLEKDGWDEDTYWRIRNSLIERGELESGRGKGGSVRRVVEVLAPPKMPASEESDLATSAGSDNTQAAERVLYEPAAEVIRTHWARDYRLDAHLVEVTAQQGARPTGGKWTRPDITVGSYKTFAYLPGRFFDLITFEIKPANALDVTVIYEALAHRRASTRAYALVHVPSSQEDASKRVLEEMASEAKRHGIGLISMGDPADYGTWEELVEAVRHEPDPERMNEFLTQQVSQGFRDQVVRWFK